jgi:ubiquinone/menaquinone biosynthesis C-methylase UbiE
MAYWDKRAQEALNDNEAIGVPREYDHYADVNSMPVVIRGSRLLDLGAGYGRYSIALAKTGTEVYAAEPAPRMIARLKANIKSENLEDKINVIRCDGRYLPFRNRAFDAAICIGTVEYFSLGTCRQVFREVNRSVVGYFMVNFRQFNLGSLRRFIMVFILRALRLSKEIQENMYFAFAMRRMLKQSGFKNLRFVSASTVLAASKSSGPKEGDGK